MNNDVLNTPAPKEKWLAAALSWLVAGLGQWYCGHRLRGVIWFGIASLTSMLGSFAMFSSRVGAWATISMLAAYVLFSRIFVSIDAYRLAKAKNLGLSGIEPCRPKNGWKAIFLSLIFPPLGYIQVKRHHWAVLVAVPIYFLSSKSYVFWGVFITLLVCMHIFWVSFENKRNSLRLFAFFTAVLALSKIVGVFTTLFIVIYIGRPYKLSGAGMAPAIEKDSLIIVNKLSYWQNSPQRGDIICFFLTESDSTRDLPEHFLTDHFAKRVVALGGDTVLIAGGRVFVNDEEVTIYSQDQQKQLAKLKPRRAGLLGVEKEYLIPENHYFLLGDNIVNSLDSRWFGPVSEENIIGKAVKILWPPNRGKLYE